MYYMPMYMMQLLTAITGSGKLPVNLPCEELHNHPLVGRSSWIHCSITYRGSCASSFSFISVVRRCQRRLQALTMILEIEAGKHEKSPLFEVERVSAFIIEPIDHTTYMTVDGEKVALERVAVEVHRKLLSVVVAPECTAAALAE
jgi:hypothetical protein